MSAIQTESVSRAGGSIASAMIGDIPKGRLEELISSSTMPTIRVIGTGRKVKEGGGDGLGWSKRVVGYRIFDFAVEWVI